MKQSIVCRFVVAYEERDGGVRIAALGARSPFDIPIPYHVFKRQMQDPTITEIEFDDGDGKASGQ